MTEQLPELKPLRGKQRVFKYYGEDNRRRYKTFLEDYYVVSDAAGLLQEGPGHRGHRHLTFSNCVANVQAAINEGHGATKKATAFFARESV